MEKIKTTLHPKDSPNDELYPNVLPSNMPVDSTLLNTSNTLQVNTDVIQVKLSSSNDISISSDNKIELNENITKSIVFNQGIKTNKINNINGYNLINDDNSKVNVGNSSRITNLQGSSARPTYNGADLALLSDSDTSHWDLLMANLGIGRWMDSIFRIGSWMTKNTINDNLAKYYTNCSYIFADVSWVDHIGHLRNEYDVYFNNPETFFGTQNKNYYNAFASMHSTGAIYLPNMYGNLGFAFTGSKFSKVLIDEGCTVKCVSSSNGIFNYMPNLTEIGAIDMSETTLDQSYFIYDSSNVKSIHCTHWKVSFNISSSIKFEEADLVEIISNLDPVSVTKTLTMGATNLAKLTNEEILVATGKGWQLA